MLERERRFRLKSPPPIDDVTASVQIEQIYTSEKDNSFCNRIRKTRGEEFILYSHCTKYYVGNKVEEIENDINELVYARIKSLYKQKPIKKKRVFVRLTNGDNIYRVAEVDYYEDGDVVVEVEFFSEEDEKSFVKPNWFGEEIIDSQNYSLNKFFSLNADGIWGN